MPRARTRFTSGPSGLGAVAISPEALADPQVVGPFERRSALTADQGGAIATQQRVAHGLLATRAVEFGGRRWLHTVRLTFRTPVPMVIRRFTGRRFPGGSRRAALVLLACAGALGALSCGSSKTSPSSNQPSIGVAYVGPAAMNLRQDLAAKSAGVIEVKHGDRLDILETRRRLIRVRTSEGIEGWADANLLLSAQQMDQLQRLASDAAKLPSQGAATALDQMNLHTEPSRSSPSFAQIPEGGSVEVLGHRATPRGVSRPRAVLATRPTPAAKASKKDSKNDAAMLPFPSLAPAPPGNWEQISRPRASDLPDYVAPAPPPPPPLDDWDLVSTRDGKVGWVLARMLYMAIPDEVAQYADGKRITAYLAIGDVAEGDQVKHNWLWATATSGLNPGEFDGLRVFVWSKSRHRYETAYIERNLTGFYPLQLAEVPGGKEKGFSLLALDKDGMLYQRTYGFSGYHVRLISKTPAPRTGGASATADVLMTDAGARSSEADGWWRKLSAWPRRWFNRP
jgi:hypothetical protein